MKLKLIIALLALAPSVFAEDLAQLFEKAYFLETAKGKTEAALEIYRQIATTEPTDENRETILKTLGRMMELYSIENLSEDTKKDRLKKAIALKETGRSEQAEEILLELSLPESVVRKNDTEEHALHHDVLDQLLDIAILEEDQKKIARLQERKLKETDETIQSLIQHMPAGSTVYLPEGTYSGSKIANRARYYGQQYVKWDIRIRKAITLKGTDREKCIIQGTMDHPIIDAGKGGKLTLENLTLKSRLSSLDKEKEFEELGCALLVEDDGTATLTNCTIAAAGPIMRCPSGVKALGFAEVNLHNCSLSGYAIPVYYGEGSSGSLTDCTVEHTLRTCEDTVVKINRSIFHDAKFNAIDCLGGDLSLDSCLIINTKEAFSVQYASRVDQFALSNSAVINCDKGLPEYPKIYSVDGPFLLRNNVFVLTKDAVADPGEHNQSAQRPELPRELTLTNNIFYAKEARVWGNALMGADIPSQKNTFWSSESWAPAKGRENATLDHMLIKDPEFISPKLGNFVPQNHAVKSADHGLTDPDLISNLWKKYKETAE